MCTCIYWSNSDLSREDVPFSPLVSQTCQFEFCLLFSEFGGETAEDMPRCAALLAELMSSVLATVKTEQAVETELHVCGCDCGGHGEDSHGGE